MIDPYDELGVGRDATSKEINAAFKKKAKANHPDHGGSAEAFDRVKQASLVLLDPAKRKKFDADGTMDGNEPDNIAATAMERVAHFFIQSLNEMSSNSQMDLNQFDLVAGGRIFFDQGITNAQKQVSEVERQIKQFEKALKRLKTKKKNDVISTMLKQHIGGLRGNIAANKKQISIFAKAKEILSDYTFDPETPEFNQTLGGLFVPRAWPYR